MASVALGMGDGVESMEKVDWERELLSGIHCCRHQKVQKDLRGTEDGDR